MTGYEPLCRFVGFSGVHEAQAERLTKLHCYVERNYQRRSKPMNGEPFKERLGRSATHMTQVAY